MRTFLTMSAALFLTVATVQAKIYKWTDGRGRVHFADNIAAVPPDYRHQVQERKSSATTDQSPQASPIGAPSMPLPMAVQHYRVPLTRAGNAVLVDVTLDEVAHTRLIVDTGASLTVIPTSVAQRLSINLNDAPTIPLQSVSGTFLAPLAKVRTIAVGSATVRDVEVVVHDIVPGTDSGLLGMSFLNNFQVTVNAEDRSMILTPLTGGPGQLSYGGHSEDWWRRKFQFYRHQITILEAYLNRKPSPQLSKTMRYFQTELASLERKASLAAVPRRWRY